MSGPATGGAYLDVIDPTISNWASKENGKKLSIVTVDPESVDYDGRYSVKHSMGKSIELSELVICKINQPASMFTSGTSETFEIVKKPFESLTIELEPYTMTEDADCGEIVYEASVTSGYDPFAAGHADMSNNIVHLDSFSEYEAGVMTVQIDIKSSFDDSAEYAAAYTISFEITVTDYVTEETAASIVPAICSLTIPEQ